MGEPFVVDVVGGGVGGIGGVVCVGIIETLVGVIGETVCPRVVEVGNVLENKEVGLLAPEKIGYVGNVLFEVADRAGAGKRSQ